MPYPISNAMTNGTPTDESQYNNLRLDALRSLFLLQNNSGSSQTEGTVAIFDSANDNGFKTTVLSGDASVIGVTVNSSIANAAFGYIAGSGIHTVKVTGNVTRGHWLVASTTAGRAKDSGSKARPLFGGIGMALTEFTGTTGTVQALLAVVPYMSDGGLQPLGTSAYGSSGSFPVTAVGDLLVVLIWTGNSGSTASSKPTAVTYAGVPMTLLAYDHAYTASNYGASIAYLRNPPLGTNNVEITAPFSEKAAAQCFGGSQATPVRAAVNSAINAATSVSDDAVSVLGDIVIDIMAITAANPWTRGAGQTLLYQDSGFLNTSTKPGAATSTTMAWSGSSATGVHTAVAIKGS